VCYSLWYNSQTMLPACPHITSHHTTNLKVVRVHFVDEHRRVMLRFHVFIHFVQMFIVENISVRIVFHSYFMIVPVHKIPSRFTIYL